MEPMRITPPLKTTLSPLGLIALGELLGLIAASPNLRPGGAIPWQLNG